LLNHFTVGIFFIEDLVCRAKMEFRPASLAILRWAAAVTTVESTISVIVFRVTMRVGHFVSFASFVIL